MLSQAAPVPVVSYCTTCKGRLAHLMKTLPANIEAERNNPNVEFIVLDYDCPDGTFEAVKHRFASEIRSGRLRCAKFVPAPTFEHSHAKNMAHRLATGTILCNVDADNFIAQNFSSWLLETFNSRPHSIVINIPVKLGAELEVKIIWRLLRLKLPTHGLAGRIAMLREDFERLGGYDEDGFSGQGGEDTDLGLRARVAGLNVVRIPHNLWGDVIRHGDDERVCFSSDTNRAHLSAELRVSRLRQLVSGVRTVLKRPSSQVNRHGRMGCGAIRTSFDSTITILSPLQLNAASKLDVGLFQRD